MRIETGEYGRNASGEIASWVESRINSPSGNGSVEDAQSTASASCEAIGRLVDLLARKGLLTAPEVVKVARGYGGEEAVFVADMSDEITQAVGAPLERQVRHCWPTPWLEAAMSAGFAHYKDDGEWMFINDKIRDMLAEFGAALQRDERERCAMLAESARPLGGRAWSSEQAACFEALTHVAQCIRNA